MKKNIFQRQQMLFWILMAVVLLPVLLFETAVLSKGGVTLSGTMQYFTEVAGVFITIGLITLALKKFNTTITTAQINDEAFLKRCRRACEIRLMLLFVVIMLNIGLYYATDNNSALYCALAGALAYLFCFPKNRITEEK